jgi:hypothetical protein
MAGFRPWFIQDCELAKRVSQSPSYYTRYLTVCALQISIDVIQPNTPCRSRGLGIAPTCGSENTSFVLRRNLKPRSQRLCLRYLSQIRDKHCKQGTGIYPAQFRKQGPVRTPHLFDRPARRETACWGTSPIP